MADTRSSRRYRRLVANLKREQRDCCICNQPIDYTIEWPHPDAFTAEHIKPWSTHPHLREDPANLGAAHHRCNSSKGDGYRNTRTTGQIGQPSRNW